MSLSTNSLKLEIFNVMLDSSLLSLLFHQLPAPVDSTLSCALTSFSSFLLLNHGDKFIKHTLYFGILLIFFYQFLKSIRDQNDQGDVMRLVLCTGRVHRQVGERGAIISIQWSARGIKQDDI